VVKILKRFTAEDTEDTEKKMASINYMKFGFSAISAVSAVKGFLSICPSGPAPDHDPGISAVRHLA
jgi:hypothetical protein